MICEKKKRKKVRKAKETEKINLLQFFIVPFLLLHLSF